MHDIMAPVVLGGNHDDPNLLVNNEFRGAKDSTLKASSSSTILRNGVYSGTHLNAKDSSQGITRRNRKIGSYIEKT